MCNAVSLVFGLVTFSLNISIVITYGKPIKKDKKLNHCDLIFFILGLINIILQSLLTVQSIVQCFSNVIDREISIIMLIFLLFYICFSCWITAWLCAYYCTTFATFSHCLFVWLKRNLYVFLPRLLLLSGIGSAAIDASVAGMIFLNNQAPSPGNSSLNFKDIAGKESFSLMNKVLLNGLGCCLPFMIISSTLLITVYSLVRHVWSLKQNQLGFCRPKLKAHINAIRTMILFLLLYIILFTAEMILFARTIYDILSVSSLVIVMLFPTIEAIVIVQASSKIRTMFGRWFWIVVKKFQTYNWNIDV